VPKNQRQHFQPIYEFDQVELVKRALEMDAGVAILPETVVRAEVAHKILAAVPFEKGGHTEPLGIIYRRKKHFSPALTRLLEFLRPRAPITVN
jgi:DNA-binding transcriptional LysR family regulator